MKSKKPEFEVGDLVSYRLDCLETEKQELGIVVKVDGKFHRGRRYLIHYSDGEKEHTFDTDLELAAKVK